MTIDREKDIAERQDDTKDLDKRQNIKWHKEKEEELRQIVPNKRDKYDKKKEEELKRDKERHKEIIIIQLYCTTYQVWDRDW